MEKNIKLFALITATIIISLYVALLIGISTFFWGFLYVCCSTVLFFVVPFMIICVLIFLTKYGKRYSRFLTLKNTIIVCVFSAIIIILPAVYFNYTSGFPSELKNVWHCDEDQVLCTNESCSRLIILFDEIYGRKTGFFYESNLTAERRFEFSWGYNGFFKEFTMQNIGFEYWNNTTQEREIWKSNWKIKLRLDFTNSKKMTTYYISANNTPFNAKLFDGITWTAS